ncbi:MAG: hypothetical protein GY719_14055 [bacterium]|nr:hypothetical protein [bacterium]
MRRRNLMTPLALFLVLVASASGAATIPIIDATGDGMATLDGPGGIAVDDAGNVYVTASTSDTTFKNTPGGVITEIIDAAGDGVAALAVAFGTAVDGTGNVYVGGFSRTTSSRSPGILVCEITIDLT